MRRVETGESLMKIKIADKDRASDLESRIRQRVEASRRHDDLPKFLPRNLASLSLSDELDREGYLEKLITLLWYRSDIDTVQPRISGGRGPLRGLLAWLRRLAWRFLQYQHDNTAFQQNVINTQITSTIEFMRESHRKEVDALQRRVDELEARVRHSGGPEDNNATD